MASTVPRRFLCCVGLILAAPAACARLADDRLVVVSNRVPVPKADGSLPPGGLTAGLEDAVKLRPTLWFGSSGSPGDAGTLHGSSRGNLELVTMDLSEELQEKYYEGFSNAYLWPLFHSLVDKVTIEAGSFEAYYRVNQLFAEKLLPKLTRADTIWVHDYHLIPLGMELRKLQAESQNGAPRPMKIGFFLHVPVPTYEVVFAHNVNCGQVLPCAGLTSLFRDLQAYDLIGVHTQADEHNLKTILQNIPGVGHIPRVETHPIGINPEEFQRLAHENLEGAKTWLAGLGIDLTNRDLLIGVDRLDYTKGIPERIHGFELMLRRHPELRESVVFLQIAPPSRQGVAMFRRLNEQVQALVDAVMLGWGGHAPLHFYGHSVDRAMIAALCRLATVGFVTPLKDGMNLVAKEFVAAQGTQVGELDLGERSAPGVLVLSSGAGAALELGEPASGSDVGPGAIIVDPYNANSVVDGLHRALTMRARERGERWRRMNAQVHRVTASGWASQFLASLTGSDRA